MNQEAFGEQEELPGEIDLSMRVDEKRVIFAAAALVGLLAGGGRRSESVADDAWAMSKLMVEREPSKRRSMEEKLRSLQDALSMAIGDIKAEFRPGIRVAVIVRVPYLDNGDVLIGDATLEDIEHVLDRLVRNPAQGNRTLDAKGKVT